MSFFHSIGLQNKEFDGLNPNEIPFRYWSIFFQNSIPVVGAMTKWLFAAIVWFISPKLIVIPRFTGKQIEKLLSNRKLAVYCSLQQGIHFSLNQTINNHLKTNSNLKDKTKRNEIIWKKAPTKSIKIMSKPNWLGVHE